MSLYPKTSTALLEIRDLHITYRTPKGHVDAVQGVDLTVAPGKITAIVGESGSGKSTTAHAAIGLLPDNGEIVSGSILIDGQNAVDLDDSEWRKIRGAQIGLVPQDPNNSLNPLKTIGASVAEALRIHTRMTAKQRRERAIELLAEVGIDRPEQRHDQYPHELSGGMKQRALIAAALALEPDLIIADEPTSALDVTVQATILDLIDRLVAEKGIGVLFITHDLAVAGDRADDIVVMQHGEVRETGLAAQVLADPRDPYSQRLVADAPSLYLNTASASALRTAGEGNAKRDIEAEAQPLLTVTDLHHEFGSSKGGRNAIVAIDDVSFSVPRGTTHAIVGQSGSGKTTTGRAISGFLRPTSGDIRLGGLEMQNLRGEALRRARTKVQLVYQNPASSLNPRRSIRSAIAEPLRNLTDLSQAQIADKIDEYVQLVSLDPDWLDRKPRQLSGGQLQRVAIARALIVEPELVVLDEAVSALDVTVQARILELLSSLQKQLGLTYVFISHDLAVVQQISDTVSVMTGGKQVEYGPTREIFESPANEYTKQLIDAIPGQRYRAGELNLGL